ncbi:DUF4190 domain-containing protein [Amycolatopsis sp. NPDC059021]|uniref:DUF4190 domain-containing protein n=1 Tax=Amycolatopsis sp. NPDC059021 TaxID=3346704 RepID=UPI003672E548
MITEPPYPRSTARHGRGEDPIAATQRRRASKVKPRRNVLGVIGLVCGVAALGVAFLPVVDLAAWPLSAGGLVLSIVGVVQARRGTVGDRGVAVTGVVVGVVAILATAGWLVYRAFFSGGTEAGLHMPAVNGDKHVVGFVVTANGGANVRYGSLNTQRTETAPSSTDAWRQQASYNSGAYLLTLTADSPNGSVNNQISCSITVDGKKVAENTGTTIALCTANVG